MEGAVLMSALAVNEIVMITSLLSQIIKPIIISHYVTKTLLIFHGTGMMSVWSAMGIVFYGILLSAKRYFNKILLKSSTYLWEIATEIIYWPYFADATDPGWIRILTECVGFEPVDA